MWKKIARWFVIKSRFEACLVIYALALGAVSRGQHYMEQYPGFGGYLLFAACFGAVFMAGAKIMEVTRRDTGERRRGSDHEPTIATRPVRAPRRWAPVRSLMSVQPGSGVRIEMPREMPGFMLANRNEEEAPSRFTH